jgi:two-component system OmpR family sensor kinase
MKSHSARSIKRFLVVSMIVVLVLISFVIGVTTFFSARAELKELYDANLRQVAMAIRGQQLALHHTTDRYRASIKGDGTVIQREEDFFIRIEDKNNHILYVSHPDVHIPHTAELGFSKVFYNNQRWRVFVAQAGTETIEVAQSVDLRIEAVTNVALGLIIPQVSFIPVIAFLVWLMVARGLYPLTVLSNSISRREHHLLEPLSLQKAPVEIVPLITALNGLLERLSNMVGLTQQFTSNAAHELRTPLTALKLQLALVERATDQVQRDQAIAQLDAGIERMTSIVQKLLTMARIERSAALSAFELVRLLDVAKQSLKTFVPLALSKRIDLGMTIQSNGIVLGDPEALLTLINNIVDNAVRYTPDGGRIDVAVVEKKNSVELEVTDTGPGIQPSDRERIFDRFYRVSGNMTPGTGLGMAIVKEIANRHQATISLNDGSDGTGLKVVVAFMRYSR